MAETNETTLLVNPGGRVVEVSKEHGEQLLESGDFKKAPKNAKSGDSIDANGEAVASQNDLVPRGSTEEEAKRIADLQGTPENIKQQAAADPTNDTVTAPNQDNMETDKNKNDPGAGAVGSDNTDNGDHPNTSGQANSTAADEAVVNGKASTGDANEKGAGRFFGRGKKK